MSPAIQAKPVSAAEPMPRIVRADARALPLADDSVDLIVTSPPYYGLRSYQDGGKPFDAQIGAAESTPAEYLDALLDVTAECVRVLKPTGSIWVNLGDRYSTGNSGQSALAKLGQRYRGGGHSDAKAKRASRPIAAMPTQPLKVPASLGVDHFAAFPMELPRRLIVGWSPRAVCTVCAQGRRPLVHAQRTLDGLPVARGGGKRGGVQGATAGVGNSCFGTDRHIRGHACACPDTTPPAVPGVVLDPFGGTGTAALVAVMHGRHGISIDASADYCRLAEWRANDPRQRAKAAGPIRSPRSRVATCPPRRDPATPEERAA